MKYAKHLLLFNIFTLHTTNNADAGKTDSDPEAAHCPDVFTVLRYGGKDWAFKYRHS